jgi:hypothetical protein
MATYSLLFIDANEHIGRSRQIESPTDHRDRFLIIRIPIGGA